MAGTAGTAGRWGMREDWLGVGWKYLVLRGAVAIVFGIVAMVWPQSTATALAFLWGVWALADGFGSLLQAFQPADSRSSRWLLVPMGLLAVVAGLVAVTSPAMTAVALTWVLGVWLLLRGLIEAVAAFGSSAGVPRGLLFLGAGLDVLLGVLFVANPGGAAVGLSVLLGLTALAWGLVFTGIGLWVRREAGAAAGERVAD